MQVQYENKLESIAQSMEKQKMLPSGMSWQNAVIVFRAGLEVSIPPQQSLNMIYPIMGKFQFKAELILALMIQRVPGFKHFLLEYTEDKVVVEYHKIGHPGLKLTTTRQECDKAGYSMEPIKKWNNSTPKPWKRRHSVLFSKTASTTCSLD